MYADYTNAVNCCRDRETLALQVADRTCCTLANGCYWCRDTMAALAAADAERAFARQSDRRTATETHRANVHRLALEYVARHNGDTFAALEWATRCRDTFAHLGTASARAVRADAVTLLERRAATLIGGANG